MEKRKRNEKFAFFLVIAVIFLFILILGAIVFGNMKPEDKTAVIGWGSLLLGVLTTAASYEWGASKEAITKNEVPPPTPGKTTMTADVHMSSASAEPKTPDPKTPEPSTLQPKTGD